MVRQYSGRRLALFLIAGCLSTGPWISGPAFAAAGDSPRSEAFFEDARKYLEKGDTNAAIIQLKNALQQDPNNVGARRMLGEIYFSAGNGPYAEKELKAVIRRQADDRKVRFMLAEAYLMQGKFKAVLKEIVDDSSDTGIRVQTLLIRGRAYLGLRRTDESENTFKEAERLRPESVRENEHLATRIEGNNPPHRRMIVRQITGAIARRIVCRLKPGDEFQAGEQFGMIKLGSRTELVIPQEDGLQIRVKVGETVKAGATIFAEYAAPS